VIELNCSTVRVRTVKRKLNAPSRFSFTRLDLNPDDDAWADNEPVKLTLAGTLAFKGTARRRGYDLDDESLTYDAVDGLVYLSKNPCPVAHEWYNRVKQSNVDEEPINQTIHDILQAEFATLVTTTVARDFAVVNSLDTSWANSVIPGEVSPQGKTYLQFLDQLMGFQPSLRYYLDYADTTVDSPYPAGTLKLIDTANLDTETLDLVVARGETYSEATTTYNVESLNLSFSSDKCVDRVDAVGRQFFETT